MSAPARTRPPSPMDARIRDRRRAVAAARMRRRRRVTSSVVALVLLAVAAVVVARSPLFAIGQVDVAGVGAPQAEVVRDALALRPGANLLFADLAGAGQRVEQIAWVREATVRRLPPSTVDVRVVPREPVAVVRLERETWLVDEEGILVAGGDAPGLAEILAPDAVLPGVGEQVRDAVVREALEVHVGLPGWLRARGATYEARSVRDIRLQLLDGTVVRLGDAGDIAAKARSVRLLLAQLAERAGEQPSAAVLDVRAPANPVLVPGVRS